MAKGKKSKQSALVRLWRKVIGGRLLILVAGLAVTFFAAVMYIYQPFFLRALDLKYYDTLLRITHNSTTTGVPFVVDIDEKALAEYGQFPWPRYRVAMLMANIRAAGAASVGLDIVFPEPDRTSPNVLKRELARDLNVDVEFEGLPDQLMDNDAVLAGVLGSGPYVLGYFFDVARFGVERGECNLHPLNAAVLKKPGAGQPQEYLFNAPDVVCNLPELSGNATASGFFNTLPDMDGILRRTPLIATMRGRIYPSLGLATLMRAFGTDTKAILKLTMGGVESVRVGNTVIPLDARGNLLINYRGEANSFSYYSAADFLSRSIPKGAMAGKLALIGTSAAGLKDIRATPFDQIYPGVEAHATVMDNIIAKDFLVRPDFAPGLEMVIILAMGLLSTLLLTYARAALSVFPLALAMGGMWYGSLWAMEGQGMYISALIPMVTVAVCFTVLTLMKFWREEGQKKFLHATFSSYLSPELINDMFENHTFPELGGIDKTITAYFTDIQSFSTFSEKLTAPQLVELLNEYLSAMTDILIAEQGTLDKYEGDAIIAFFGAPMDVPDHALRASRTAVAMQNKLLELREKWTAERLAEGEEDRNTKNLPEDEWSPGERWPKVVHEMKMRIGVNTGEIVVGNMGSAMRMNYTMMGDSVNLAARLEAGAKQYGIYTCLSQYTMGQPVPTAEGAKPLSELVEARHIDSIIVVGKSEPVDIYELCAMKGGLTEQEQRLFSLFDEAMALYKAMRWDEAIAKFTEAKEVERVPEGKTTPSQVFIERCELFKENPPVAPGEAWDGVFRLTSK